MVKRRYTRQLTSSDKKRILEELHRIGYHPKKISENLTPFYNFTERQVRYFLYDYSQRRVLSRKEGSHPPLKLNPLVYETINLALSRNAELTIEELKRIIDSDPQLSNTDLSISTIDRAVKKLEALETLGWRFRNTRYCQHVRPLNIKRRLKWAQKIQSKLEEGHSLEDLFGDMFFTDESMIMLERYLRKSRARKGSKSVCYKGKHKYPARCMIWAGISFKGATNVLFVPGRINAAKYQEVLSAGLLERGDMLYNGRGKYRLMQDNAKSHGARSTRQWLFRNNIHWFRTPAESPDLNPIELLWHELKHYLRKVSKPRTLDELKAGIKTFWRERVTPEKCRRYIRHLQVVIPAVIANKGLPTGY